ncbi:hypothetical protein GQX73_g4984 [Xylaria multiplex]|uniref:DJ-1/PfpI domain-containing protein n=1 Tax=Xylaria multiplex TaxID=323545 RepID=A0A7C8N7P7_9PEZI|nr:hypothetical protein GQX73_g4984 [Xylaria multiplex]
MAQRSATNPGLMANLVARVILAFAGILLCWVPVRLLSCNGEFAAVVFIADVAIMNLFTILNSIIWHDDDWNTWWDGTGLCDVEVYLSGPLQTIYAASIFAVMYHLAQQVKVTRAGQDRSQITRRNLIQAAIIFPIPLVQLLFTYFDLAQRYIIGTLIGCSAVYDSSWPKALVYDAPPAIFAILAVPYAVLLWRRYHVITKQTQGFFKSSSQASIRANRTRIRLYNMSLSILVIYLPVMVYFLVYNIKDTFSSYKAYNFNRMRWSATPYPWDTILFVPSWIIPSSVLNQPWIPIATTVAIMAFFGTTTEAQQVYLQYADYVGLGTCFRKPKQRQDQAPAPADESQGTHDSKKALLPNHAKESVEHQRGRNSILPTIEQADNVRIPQPQSSLTPRYQRGATKLEAPPVIPPRYSSLHRSLTFRTPTLRSIKKTIRIPLLESISRSLSASSTSNDTTGNLPGSSSNRIDSIPMLPLNNRALQRNTDPPDSFLTRDIRSPTNFSAQCSCENSRPESRLEVRTPIVHQHSAPARYDKYGNRTNRVHGVERESFPREETLTSFLTTSDTLKGETELQDIAPVDMLHGLSRHFISTLPDALGPPGFKDGAIDFKFLWITEAGSAEPANLTGGLRILPTNSFATSPALDIVIVGAHRFGYEPSEAELAFATKSFESCAAFIAVCGGVDIPRLAGLLEGKTATGPRPLLDAWRAQSPGTHWVDKRWQRDGKMWTSGALFNGCDLITNFVKQTWGGTPAGAIGDFAARLGAWPDRDVDFKDVL